MKSPGAEWVLGIGYLAALDVIRAHGEADDDTLSEVLRGHVARHPHGKRLFAAAVLSLGIWFHQHITSPLKEQP